MDWISHINDSEIGIHISRTLQWDHNGRDGISNHEPHSCLLNRLFRCRSKKTSKFRVTGLCVGNSPVTGEFPAQRATNAENVSISWRHHEASLNTQGSQIKYRMAVTSRNDYITTSCTWASYRKIQLIQSFVACLQDEMRNFRKYCTINLTLRPTLLN